MKKATVIVVFLFVSFFVFAQGTKEDGKTEVELCSPDNTYGLSTDPELQASITEIIEEKTGVTINPIITPLASYTDKLATLLNSGDAPDVFAVNQAMVKIPQMVARGQLLDITEYIKNSEKLKIIDSEYFSTPYTEGKNYLVIRYL